MHPCVNLCIIISYRVLHYTDVHVHVHVHIQLNPHYTTPSSTQALVQVVTIINPPPVDRPTNSMAVINSQLSPKSLQ